MNSNNDKPNDPRVNRGGCWNNHEPLWARAASRLTFGTAYRNYGVGFRCALRGRSPRV